MDKKNLREAERVWRILKSEYAAYLSYRDRVIRLGLIALLTLPFLFMLLMFFMPSKIVFLCLWIISFIAIAVILTYVEYKGYYYKRLFGYDTAPQDKNANDDAGKESYI